MVKTLQIMIQEGEDVVPRSQGGLVRLGECQECPRNATEYPHTDPSAKDTPDVAQAAPDRNVEKRTSFVYF